MGLASARSARLPPRSGCLWCHRNDTALHQAGAYTVNSLFFRALSDQERTIATTISPPTWTTRDSEKLYNMSGWGQGYFRVNEAGHVTVHPDGNPKRGLDLYQLALDLNAQGVGLPLLLRFSDILRSRIQALAGQFESTIKEFGYDGSYTTVYPVKVNQQRHVCRRSSSSARPTGPASSAAASPSSWRCSASTRAPTI